MEEDSRQSDLYEREAYQQVLQVVRSSKTHYTLSGVIKAPEKRLTTGDMLFNDNYVLAQLVGVGAFGNVYRAVKTCNGGNDYNHFPLVVAVKVENNVTGAAQTAMELTVLTALNKNLPHNLGYPKVYWSGSYNGQFCIIMDLLGPNLQQLMKLCGGRFSLQTVLLLGLYIFERIEMVHKAGFVYRDVKPENFVMGLGANSKEVFLIDYGLCKRYRDYTTKLFLPYKENISMAGTIRYSSLNSHLGIDQTRRDDLYAACYLLIYLIKGDLPWQGLAFEHKFEKDHMIMESKLKATPSSLCDGLPVQIGYIFEYTKSLDFYEDPDYRFISIELANAIEACCDESNLQYDWETLPEGTHFCEGELNIVYPEQRVEEEPSKSTYFAEIKDLL